MFDIGAPELLVLIVSAVILFGPDKLPEFFRKAARVLRYVRGMAGSAQDQLKAELGEDFDDFDFRDLNPKQFIQKHLFEDVEPILADVKSELNGVAEVGAAGTAAVNEALISKSTSDGGPVPQPVGAGAAAVRFTPYDPDAT